MSAVARKQHGGGDNTDGKCPTFSPIGGFYKEKQSVTISCEDSDEIYYTILKPALDSDGNWDESAWKTAVAQSKPTENSTRYTGAFEVEEQCIIRAVAVKSDGSKNYAMTCFDFDLDRTTDAESQFPTNPESENWQDQTIYFILTDRFFNGDMTNDHVTNLKDQNGNDYDERIVLEGQPTSGYNGGDIEGIRQKLDYIKDLGFTAIWITPPIKNQIAETNFHGYHGYWASDFTKVDSHMGTLEQYQRFVKEAHDKGLYVIQDIVVNHTGDYQKIAKDVTAETMKSNAGNIPESEFYLEPKSVPFSHPEQLPWALNNINDLTYDEWKNNSFFHYNTGITDYTNLDNMHTHQSADLDDMVTESPVVRNLLRGYFRYWIDKAGIDGYRIDTALYVEPDFFEGFINDTDPDNMGTRPYGISKGKKDFINFGEAFSQDESVCGSYTKSPSGNERMDGMIYFPLRYAIADTISSGSKTSAIGDVLKNRYEKNYYSNPDRLVTFIDNHDMDRWPLTVKGNKELIKMAYGIIYTIPGIPQVYYGSEQGFDGEDRAGMFKGSFLSAGQVQTEDKFDTNNEWYKYFQTLNKMRKENRVFRYNTLNVLQETDDSAGVFAYIVQEKDEGGNLLSGVKNKAIYVMNTANADKILDASFANLASGDKFTLVDKLNGSGYEGVSSCSSTGTQLAETFTAHSFGGSENGGNAEGVIRFIVPAQSCAVYILSEVNATTTDSNANLEITSVPAEKVNNSVTIKGKSDKNGEIKIVLNGDYSSAQSVTATANQEFEKTIDTAFATTLDIQGVDVYRQGNDILLGVKMAGISHAWGPTSNLFDHVGFFVFISDGTDSGCEYHPQYNYKLPENFGKWNYMFLCYGWAQAYYSSANADANNFGTATTPAPQNNPPVDWDNIPDDDGDKYVVLDWSGYNPEIGSAFEEKPGMIYFRISAAALGSPSSLKGYKFYLNTWDFDMQKQRGMKAGDATQWNFGTGDLPLNDVPYVCDELDNVIVITN